MASCPTRELTPFCLYASSMSDAKTASSSDWGKDRLACSFPKSPNIRTEQIRLVSNQNAAPTASRRGSRTFQNETNTNKAQHQKLYNIVLLLCSHGCCAPIATMSCRFLSSCHLDDRWAMRAPGFLPQTAL